MNPKLRSVAGSFKLPRHAGIYVDYPTKEILCSSAIVYSSIFELHTE
jgi:hypothetical protein